MATLDLAYFDEQAGQLICQGEWSITTLNQLSRNLEHIKWPEHGNITIDGQCITKMDSTGAWFLNEWIAKISTQQLAVHLNNFSNSYQKLLSFDQKYKGARSKLPRAHILPGLAQLGKSALKEIHELHEYINFIGLLVYESLRLFNQHKRWHWNTVMSTINTSGVSALPIIALISFMIGVVISYQMGNQLQNYGANVFIVDLVGFSVLREFGPLLTAIMVTGRTGSAFAAQLGLMKINQEIDALNIMGVTPAELLLLPRILAIFIVVPLLTIWADIFGVLGGILMAQNLLDVTWHEFLTRFRQEVPLRALLIGLGKAPVFALIIASIGCFQGMKVDGSAENVGTCTTRSVVLSIFFIIVADAMFSVILSWFKL